MKKTFVILMLSCLSLSEPIALSSTEANSTPIERPFSPAALPKENFSCYMMIDPKERSFDYQQAFEMLRKEKTAGKVYFQLLNGTTIANIIDMTLLPNSTLILFRFNSLQGIKLQLVKVEEISSLCYN